MKLPIGTAAIVLCLAASVAPAVSGAPEMPANTAWPVPEDVSTEELAEGWYAVIDTSRGRILARLLPEQSPQAVAHFAALASGRMEWSDPVQSEPQKGHYYDGVRVHLAKAGERFEAGDRSSGTGRGAPQIWIAQEGQGPVNFTGAGRLGMTRSAGGRISGVQFFVSAASLPWLNGKYPCFGVVLDGVDVAFEISAVKTYGNGRPVDDVVIDRIRVFSVGRPGPLPEPQAYTPSRVEIKLREDKTKR